jgi:hypothetical protein
MSADTSGVRSMTARCPNGKVVIGGGFDTSGVNDPGDIVIIRSSPSGNDSWTVEATSLGSGFKVGAYAVCARTN